MLVFLLYSQNRRRRTTPQEQDWQAKGPDPTQPPIKGQMLPGSLHVHLV
jgi:hypothetical protein